MSGNISLLSNYFPQINKHQKEQFEKLYELYVHWNAQINVISRKDIDQLYERHILHSLGIAKVIAFKPKTKILDVGTGGGFPGIPLSILFPECNFHLVDSIGKKIKVVKAVAESLGLENVFAEQARAEQVNDKFDFVVSRAVTQLPEFVEWVRKKVLKTSFNDIPNGVLCLKGGDLKEELSSLDYKYKIYDLGKYFSEAFFETKKLVYIRL
ncbi:MAG: 16S rRNA (guanine(527)-N(7))-methyltransferase RsmG [Bacteroidetes bacterium]|nr:16S rRNA (guanine(527)-N(7))-methyltransferase RsmG [Bacteroidota bacterium]HET6244041.1 16S rRNA (guanine(527)-N(7))-methyltransferase RsmG [Bacteroidia bacterium]